MNDPAFERYVKQLTEWADRLDSLQAVRFELLYLKRAHGLDRQARALLYQIDRHLEDLKAELQ